MRILNQHFPSHDASIISQSPDLQINERDQKQLKRFAHQWDRLIRLSLIHMASEKWPDQRMLGFLPRRVFRLRQEQSPGQYIWWVEHDIPPYDVFHCEAYYIKLALGTKGERVFTVLSGTNSYPIPDPITTTLEVILQKATQDPPLIIPRRMGAAAD